MSVSEGFTTYVLDQMEGMGVLRSNRMFGGVGIYCDELFFAIISDDTLYLKVDDSNRHLFTDRGLEPFRPYKDKPASLNYYTVPPEVLEDSAVLKEWAATAVEVAARKKSKKRKG